MTQNYTGEKWRKVDINLGQADNKYLEVSNFGRVKSYSQLADGNLLKGSLINGYPIVKLKFYAPHNEAMQAEIKAYKTDLFNRETAYFYLTAAAESEEILQVNKQVIKAMQKELVKKQAAYTKYRTINYHSLIHRLVATYFLATPSTNQTIVAHIDFDKLNNRASNLKWMTPEENIAHQAKSPLVVADKANRSGTSAMGPRNSRLSITKVMLLKKHINEGRNMAAMTKHFKISDTQILRIKRGENWADVPAAK